MTTPTQRTLRLLRDQGWPLVQVVEHWNPFANVRQDLFGFVDVLAVKCDTVLAVQTTSGSNVSARMHKLEGLEQVKVWLQSPDRHLVIHGWRKVKNRWRCRVVRATRFPSEPVVWWELGDDV